MSGKTSKEELVELAGKFFYESGYHCSNLDAIMAKAGVTKVFLYSYFKSKEDLILATLKQRDRKWQSWFFEEVERSTRSPEQRLKNLFLVLEEWFDRKEFFGCHNVKALTEFPHKDSLVHQLAAGQEEVFFKRLVELVEDADIEEPEKLGEQLFVLIKGAMVVAQMTGCGEVADVSKRAACQLVDEAMRISYRYSLEE